MFGGLVVIRSRTAAIWEGRSLGQRMAAFGFGFGFFFFDLDAGHGGLLFALRAGRILKLGTEPADDARPFRLGALGVQRHEALEVLCDQINGQPERWSCCVVEQMSAIESHNMKRPERLAEVVSQHNRGIRNFRVLDVSGSSVAGTTFRECNFDSSTLEECGISDVMFESCNFVGTDLRTSRVGGRVTFNGCKMPHARFIEASLSGVIFDNCDLQEASFESARLSNVEFKVCTLDGASFANTSIVRSGFRDCSARDAVFSGATLAATDLTSIADAVSVVFGDGAIVDWRSVCRSLHAEQLEILLVSTGMPEVFATYLVSCAKAIDPDQLFKLMRSTFISYGTPNVKFATKLRDNLRRNGVDTFFFASDAVPGQRLPDMMRKGVNSYDRVIVVCSASSLRRPGVRNEITEAIAREARDGGASYLVPVALDNAIFELDDELALILRGRVVADFRKKKDYAIALQQLLRALSRGAIDGA
jgi:uncharacterized protein YjbI with pentapeptide repeats